MPTLLPPQQPQRSSVRREDVGSPSKQPLQPIQVRAGIESMCAHAQWSLLPPDLFDQLQPNLFVLFWHFFKILHRIIPGFNSWTLYISFSPQLSYVVLPVSLQPRRAGARCSRAGARCSQVNRGTQAAATRYLTGLHLTSEQFCPCSRRC